MASPTFLSRESSESHASADAPSLAAGSNATRVTLAMGLGTIGGSAANAAPAAEPWSHQASDPLVCFLLHLSPMSFERHSLFLQRHSTRRFPPQLTRLFTPLEYTIASASPGA